MIRASFGKTVARSTLIGGLALLAVPAIAGCEAGANAPTLEFHPAAAGAQANVNGISISNAFVLGAPSGSTLPAGSSASMFMGLYNSRPSADTLVSVTAPDIASSVEIKGGSVALAANSPANLTGPEPSLILKGLKSPLQGGTSVPVTLDFAHAGVVTMNVPVEPDSFYYSTYSPPPGASPAAASPSATPSGTATATPSGTATATPSGTATPKPGASLSTTPTPSPSATK